MITSRTVHNAMSVRRGLSTVASCAATLGPAALAQAIAPQLYAQLSVWNLELGDQAHARELLEEVLIMEEPSLIRCHLELVLDEMGLGSLIRAGRK